MELLKVHTYATLYREKFEIEEGRQPQNGIFIVHSGKFSCTIRENSFIAGPGDLVIFPMKSSFTRKILEPCKFQLIYFTLNSGHPRANNLPEGKIEFQDTGRFQANKRYLLQYGSRIDSTAVSDVEHIVNDFLFQYFAENFPCDHTNALLSPVLQRVIAFFLDNLHRPVTLDEASAVAGLSRNGLIRHFREEIGYTPMDYLRYLRLCAATEELTHSEKTIGQIAAQFGYDNIYYFSNLFKKAYGCSPSRFRRDMKHI